MRHPFALELSELEAVNAGIEEELTDSEAEKISGGAVLTTLALGEEGGCDFTTMAVGEEGGGDPTTMAVGEEGGGDLTTLALGEEGGGCFPNIY